VKRAGQSVKDQTAAGSMTTGKPLFEKGMRRSNWRARSTGFLYPPFYPPMKFFGRDLSASEIMRFSRFT